MKIAARLYEIELAVQLRDLRLHFALLCSGCRSQATLHGCNLRLYLRAPRIELPLHLLQRVGRGGSIRRGFLRQICFAGQ